MPLIPGACVGPYEILSPLGAGGMGEVYRARDAKLNRQVALKVLPALFALDAERLARFQREAQVLASIAHPNIGVIFGFEESTGVQALVLELVEGPTLADRIAQRPIPLDEALPIARQIAEGLEAAHEQGIVHRDLKPANIKLRPDGTVKLLDFGLAKVLEPVAATAGDMASATITSPAMTQMGTILGTAAYMSPEQTKGRPADKRSDVWAFGAVLYEMLSGRRAFEGDDMSDTLAAVLRQDVDWTALPAATPPALRRLLARCLDRDVRRRLRDIGEARILLEDPAAAATRPPVDVNVGRSRAPLWRRAMPLALVVAVAAGALGAAATWSLLREPAAPRAITRFTFPLPPGQEFSASAGLRRLIAISPDGAHVVYGAGAQLYLRPMSQLEARAIQGTEGFQSVTDPVFSPDGQSIVFFALADRTLKKVAISGGAPVRLCPADNPFGISWGPAGIFFGQGSKGIMKVSATPGGTPEIVARVKDDEEAHGPQLLPDGNHLLFTIGTGTARDRWDKARIVVQSLTSGERTLLVEGGGDARYVPTHHIVYALSGSMYAVAFDPQRLKVTSDPVRIVDGVRRAAGGSTAAAHFSFSENGSLVYVPGPSSSSSPLLDLALIDRNGVVERLKLAAGAYMTPRISPDGRSIAFVIDDGSEASVWIYDVSGATAKRRLTFGGNNRAPTWSADGRHVAFQSDRDGDLAIFWQSTDGGAAERLTRPNPGEAHTPESWSPTTDTLLFSVRKGASESLATLSLDDRKVTPFGDVHSSSYTTGAQFSPDGRWVAYTGSQGDRTTIYVQPFPANGTKHQLPAKDGDIPHMVLWSPDGKELFYDPRAGGFEAVSVTTQPAFAFGEPVALAKPFQLGPGTVRRTYDITRGGKFVGLVPPGQREFLSPIAPQIQVVLNWFEELKTRVPAK
jgi:serine/threonine-protein kinase